MLVTALDRPSGLMRGLDAGADDFLSKPIDETALLARTMLVEDSPASAALIETALRKHHFVERERDRAKALDVGASCITISSSSVSISRTETG